MPALDSCEPQIIRAFEKEGWEIIKKPHAIRALNRNLLADVSFRRVKDGKIELLIIVEVKCFTNPENILQDFYTATGQYNLYAAALALRQPNIPLYLAVPRIPYERFLSRNLFEIALQRIAVKLVIVGTLKEEIFAWLP